MHYSVYGLLVIIFVETNLQIDNVLLINRVAEKVIHFKTM